MMMHKPETKNIRLRKRELTQRILDVRYTDVEEENRLCKELLGIVEPNQELYYCAFAHVYLMDSFLAMGDYSNCVYHLMRAEELCRENGYDDLLMVLCNLAGLYYSKLNNEQFAVKYHLEGLEIAQKLDDSAMLVRHYNNIGFAFGYREDCEVAKKYFELAFSVMEPCITPENQENALNCLCNIAEMCMAMEDYDQARQILEKCDALSDGDAHNTIRTDLGWIAFFGHTGDKKQCLEYVNKVVDNGFLDYPDKFFACYMLEGIVGNLMDVGERTEAKHYLDILDGMETEASLANRYHIQELKIRYWKEEDEKEYGKALKGYYEIMKQLTKVDDEMRIQSMVSQIEIVRAQWDRQTMRSETEELERLTQLDALTGLYNRRYLNKLMTKTLQQDDLVSLGYIMLDVDFFKQYNDFYGHFNGDKALEAVGQVLSENAGEGIYAGRYGGDEFFCLCVNLTDEEIADYVKRVQEDLARKNIPHEKSACCERLTLSIGYHNRKISRGERAEDILNIADSALYQVKKDGRNGSMMM